MSPAISFEIPSQPRRPAARRERTRDSFKAKTSIQEKQREQGKENVPLHVVYLGIAISPDEKNKDELLVGITAHDGTYSVDYNVHTYHTGSDTSPAESDTSADKIPGTASSTNSSVSLASVASDGISLVEFVLQKVEAYSSEHHYKVMGCAITKEAAERCPNLPSQLWLKLDVVCFVFPPFEDKHKSTDVTDFKVDEESDSVVRKAIEKFGPGNLPRLMVKYRNKVGVDVDGTAHITSLSDYPKTVHPNTWKATMHFANSLKKNETKIAFFNSTPQGGGVALMRHALIRFLRLVGVNCEWYVPRPKPEVFRITKNNHNILQGVDTTGSHLDAPQIRMLDDWCTQNADRYWTRKGGPLAARSDGGADVIIVDDPQMPMLVNIAKHHDPTRPVIFRSHIQVRADLADTPGTSTAGVWSWIWNHIQACDVFVSHPVPDFVPANVPSEKVGYLPATTDWLDGLNKPLADWDSQFYMHEFSLSILSSGFPFRLAFPARPYIVQIARFDPAKGIPTVLAAYAELRRTHLSDMDPSTIPQLVIAGHGAIDDPDATPIYNQTMTLIQEEYKDFEKDIVVMRVGPTDQILNTLLSNAHVALQLSTREGFEVKVSEALHHGVPVIATNRGGIPLQVQHGRNGFLVNSEDHSAVARYLNYLIRDDEGYRRMAEAAETGVSDEVSTVGNALSWLYLADTLAKGGKVRPERRWINDMAREEAGVEYVVGEETVLPRALHLTR